MLHQRLPGTLGDRAMRLPGCDHRIDDDPIIVDRGMPNQSDTSGPGESNLDLDDVGAVRKVMCSRVQK